MYRDSNLIGNNRKVRFKIGMADRRNRLMLEQ